MNISHQNHHSEHDEGRRETVYTCPMHPEIQQEKSGMCPECGMQLVPVLQKKPAHGTQNDFNKHAGHSTAAFLQKFWVVLVLTIPILAYSEIAEKAFVLLAPRFAGFQYVILFLASIVFFYGGWIFIAGAYRHDDLDRSCNYGRVFIQRFFGSRRQRAYALLGTFHLDRRDASWTLD